MNVKDAGLARDRGDEKGQRLCKDDMIGFTYKNEFFQPMPYFFTREGNVLPLVGQYRGSVAFLIAGGPSFKDVDKSLLKNCFTISLNNAVKTHRTDAWTCVDDPCRFLYSIWMDPKIMKFVPYAHAEKQIWDSYNKRAATWQNGKPILVGDCPNMVYYRRNSKFEASRWMTESTINWGNAQKFGGARSVMLPALRILFLLGFRTVYMLGVDLDMSKDKGYHFEEKRDKGAIKCNNSTYKRMNEDYFKSLRPRFEEFGYNVFNCNPTSKLEVFDYKPLEEAVKHAGGIIGDINSEETMGMYEDPDVKFGRKKSKKDLDKKPKSSANDNSIKELEEGVTCQIS